MICGGTMLVNTWERCPRKSTFRFYLFFWKKYFLLLSRQICPQHFTFPCGCNISKSCVDLCVALWWLKKIFVLSGSNVLRAVHQARPPSECVVVCEAAEITISPRSLKSAPRREQGKGSRDPHGSAVPGYVDRSYGALHTVEGSEGGRS